MSTYLIRRNSNPFAEAMQMSRAMDRLIRNTWQRDAVSVPAMDIVETDDAFVAKLALPGWKPEQVDISFENGRVTIKGETAEETDKTETEKVHVRELHKESFERSFTLPVDVEADKAAAEFEHGVLTLRIPKAEVVKPKQIKIAVK